jgi:hypothetical protein
MDVYLCSIHFKQAKRADDLWLSIGLLLLDKTKAPFFSESHY